MAGVPDRQGAFLDLSQALSAAGIAVAGAAALGGGSLSAVAIGVALAVAAVLFAFVLRHRTEPRWAVCLVAAVAMALLAGPLTAALSAGVSAVLPEPWSVVKDLAWW